MYQCMYSSLSVKNNHFLSGGSPCRLDTLSERTNSPRPLQYYCQTTAEETLGYDEIAELIHLLDPSITAAQAKTVLLNLRQVVTERVADGKFVKLENFVSFMPRLPVRLDVPTDDIPPDAVKVAAKIPRQFNLLGFDADDEDLGIFLVDANDNEIEQDKIGLNDPSNDELDLFLCLPAIVLPLDSVLCYASAAIPFHSYALCGQARQGG